MFDLLGIYNRNHYLYGHIFSAKCKLYSTLCRNWSTISLDWAAITNSYGKHNVFIAYAFESVYKCIVYDKTNLFTNKITFLWSIKFSHFTYSVVCGFHERSNRIHYLFANGANALHIHRYHSNGKRNFSNADNCK